jgi:hypothetical protein
MCELEDRVVNSSVIGLSRERGVSIGKPILRLTFCNLATAEGQSFFNNWGGKIVPRRQPEARSGESHFEAIEM